MRAYGPLIAKLVKDSRLAANLSQTELSFQLKYKNGQYVSNVERGLCGIPEYRLLQTAELLKIDVQLLVGAMVEDYANNLQTAIAFQRELVALEEKRKRDETFNYTGTELGTL